MKTKNSLIACGRAAILALLAAGTVASGSAGVISVNFAASAGQAVTGAYGITNLNTVVSNWVNLVSVNSSNSLPFAGGTISTVNLTGTSNPGWGSANAAYALTPFRGGKAAYGATGGPTFTLSNLKANFPNGYQVIAYVGGYDNCSNAFIANNVGLPTYYYRPPPTNQIASAMAAGWYEITQTNDLGLGNNPAGQYVVFGKNALLTNDTITFTMGVTYGQGCLMCGFQIVGTAFYEPFPQLLASEGFNASGYSPGVLLLNNATLGFGYDGPWTGYGGQVKILTNSLTYPGYGADGENHVQLTNNSAIRRQFLTGNNGPLGNYLDTNGLISLSRDGLPLYLAFLMYSPTNLPGGNFSFYVGDYTGTNRFFMVQLATTSPFPITATVPYNGSPQTLGNNNNAANLVVARFDFAGTNGAVKLWLNPSTAGSEPAANATFTNLAIAFDRLQLTHGYASGAVEFDEIRFGNNWASTVQSNALATLPGLQTLVGMRGLPPSPIGGTNFPREFFPFVDAFGQFRHAEWTNKVHSVAELLQSATNEAADLAANPGSSEWDQYGGWLNGPQLTATGFFRVQKYQGDWWFVDPDGHLFWSHGVTGVNAPSVATAVDGRQNYFANLPLPNDASYQFYDPFGSIVASGYYGGSNPLTMDFMAANALQKYGTNWYWFTRDLDQTRLRSWGMNTIGSWTTSDTYLMRRTPYAQVFYPWVGPINGDSRMPDYFDPAFATSLTNVLSGPVRNDPWCIGFYINNELDWTRPSALPDPNDVGRTALAAVSTSYAKLAFRNQLTNKYATIGALNTQWGTAYASWTDFLNKTNVFPAGTSGDTDLNAFYRNYAEQFFRTSATVIHGYTSNLFLGSRFAGQPHADAARACTNYVDVATFNQYNNTVSIPTGLEADIPLLNTEYNFCAEDTGLYWGGLNTVASQAARASSYTSHFNSAVNNARFVGEHWFQMLDRSTTGILSSDSDGNNNNGLVDVTDTPYAPLIAATRSAGQVMYSQRLGTTPPTISAITNRTIPVNSNTGPIAFTIGDDLTAVGSLVLSKDCSNTNLIPLNNIVFGGSGANRTVTITPRTNYAGTATITLTVTDGAGARDFTTFVVTVSPNPPILSNSSVSNQVFRVTISGNAGVNYYIQASTNLTSWQPVFTNLNATPPLIWTDVQTTNFPRRFYRVLVGS